MYQKYLHICTLFQEAVRFRHINKEEEPPLRTLDHGLHGEGVRQLVAPYPYMVQSSDGVWYHGFRFDQVSILQCDSSMYIKLYPVSL